MDSLAGFVYPDDEFGEVRLIFCDEILAIITPQSDECIKEMRLRIATVLSPFAIAITQAISGGTDATAILETLKMHLDHALDDISLLEKNKNT